MKRLIITAAAGAVLLVGGVALGLSLADGAGPASAQQADQQPTAVAGGCGQGGGMLQHMQQMHDGDDIQAMRQHMDAVHGSGSFDRMAGQCPGSPVTAGTPDQSSGDSDGAGWPGGMMGGNPGGGMMGSGPGGGMMGW